LPVVDRVSDAADFCELVEQFIDCGQRAGCRRLQDLGRVQRGDLLVGPLREQGLAAGGRVRGQDPSDAAAGAYNLVAFDAVEVEDTGGTAHDAQVHGLAGQVAQGDQVRCRGGRVAVGPRGVVRDGADVDLRYARQADVDQGGPRLVGARV